MKFSNFVSQKLFIVKLLYFIKSRKSDIGADLLSKYHQHWSTSSLIQLTSYLFVAGSCHAHVIGASCQSLCTLGRGWRGRWSEMTICEYFSWGLIINEVHRPLVMFSSNYKVRACFHDVHAWCLYTPILKPCRVMATAPSSSALELMAGNLTIVLASVNIGSHSHFVQSAELAAYFSFLCRSEINLCICAMPL